MNRRGTMLRWAAVARAATMGTSAAARGRVLPAGEGPFLRDGREALAGAHDRTPPEVGAPWSEIVASAAGAADAEAARDAIR